MENLFKPEQYKKKIEPFIYGREYFDKEFIESFIRLQIPIGNFSAEGKTGETKINSEKLDLEISFEAPRDYHEITIRHFLDKLVSKMGLRESDFLKISKIEDWRIMNKFNFKFKDGDNINLFDIMPENCKIIFYDNPEFIQSAYIPAVNEILYIGKLNSVITIPTLLHEIGHGWDIKKLKELGVDSLIEYERESLYLENIRKERSATAFAIKKLKTLVKDENIKKDINNFLKNLALGSHCQNGINDIDHQ